MGAVVGALLGAAAARRRYLVVTVKGPSMRPSLDHGDRLLVHRRHQRPRRGDVVVFQSPPDGAGWAAAPPLASLGRGDWNVKRVVAVPGDPVPWDAFAACRSAPGARVPAGSLVVFGDGTDSYDSRAWGLLPLDRVLGVARRRLTGGAGSQSDR